MTIAALAQYEGTPGFRSYARVFKKLQKEFARCGARIEKVELIGSRDPRSALRRFFTLEKADQADRWLSVEGTGTRPIKVLAPFRRGLTLPYTLEIGLSSRLAYTGGLHRNMLLSARWELQPTTQESRDLAAQLDSLKLPSINWRHDSGGLPIVIKEASRLEATRETVWPIRWVIISGYQGFLFNIGPRIEKYVAFAPQLESFLANWKPRQLAKATPPRRAETAEPALQELASALPQQPDPAPVAGEDPPLELPDKSVIDAVMVGDGLGGKRR